MEQEVVREVTLSSETFSTGVDYTLMVNGIKPLIKPDWCNINGADIELKGTFSLWFDWDGIVYTLHIGSTLEVVFESDSHIPQELIDLLGGLPS